MEFRRVRSRLPGESMPQFKRSVTSAVLGRPAHADVFELGSPPAILVVLFAGAGVDEEEYRRRGETVIPVFGPTFDRLASEGSRAVVAHVTAPFDLPFVRFAEEPAASACWTAHVADELLAPWLSLPFVAGGFSSAASLALSGLHLYPRSVGGFGIAPVGLSERFRRPDQWPDPLRLYVGTGDPVCARPATRASVERLAAAGAAVIPVPASSHGLAEYATPACLGDLVRWAERLSESVVGQQ